MHCMGTTKHPLPVFWGELKNLMVKNISFLFMNMFSAACTESHYQACILARECVHSYLLIKQFCYVLIAFSLKICGIFLVETAMFIVNFKTHFEEWCIQCYLMLFVIIWYINAVLCNILFRDNEVHSNYPYYMKRVKKQLLWRVYM